MENLYEKWETLSPVEKFQYAEEYWDAVESPNKWYAMNDFDNHFADYSPFEIVRKLAMGKFNPHDSFFKYDHNGNVISGTSADVMVTINDNIDEIIDYFEEQEY